VSHLAEFRLPDNRIEPTKNGLSTRVAEEKFEDGQFVRMTIDGAPPIAIGIYNGEDKSIRPKVVLI
jgi:hypothetical protein